MAEVVRKPGAGRRIYQFLTTGAANKPMLELWAPVQFDRHEGLPPVWRRPLGLRRLA